MAPSTHHIIPEGESYCVWMDAGLVNYKLCNCSFECETCEFDAVMRSQAGGPGYTMRASTSMPERGAQSRSADTGASVDDLLGGTMQQLVDSIARCPLPGDRLYSADHTWVKEENDDLSVLGIDHCIGHLLSSAHSVAFPAPPTRIRTHEPFAWIVANGQTLAVRSPIAGTIVEVNAALADSTTLLHTDPYDSGWIAKIRPRHHAPSSALMNAEQFLLLLEKDSERFKSGIDAELRSIRAQIQGTMSDGGVVLDNFEMILGPKRYYEIVERLIVG